MSSDVFISYQSQDRPVAQALGAALAADGYAVWWDRDLVPGENYAVEIQRQLDGARCVVVLWSAASVASSYVLDEASRARDAKKLLPVRIEEMALPLGFGMLHTPDLLHWDGAADDPAYQALCTEIGKREDRPPAPPPPPPFPPRWLRKMAVPAAAFALGAGTLWNVQALWPSPPQEISPEKKKQAEQATSELGAGMQCAAMINPADFSCAVRLTRALAEAATQARGHYFLAQEYLRLYQAMSPDEQQDARYLLVGARASLLMADQLEREHVGEGTGLLQQIRPLVAWLKDKEEAQPLAMEVQASAPAATEPVARLARLDAGSGQKKQAQDRVAGLLSGDPEKLLAATSAFALDATLAADAMPLVLQRAQAALDAQRDSQTARAAVAWALNLLRHGSPALLRTFRQEAQSVIKAGDEFGGAVRLVAKDVNERLKRAESAELAAPVVVLRVSSEAQLPLAKRLLAQLTAAGYSSPGIEVAGPSDVPARAEVRSHAGSDPGLARWIAQHLAQTTQTHVPVFALRGARPANDTYEIWFDKSLCAPSHAVSACEAG